MGKSCTWSYERHLDMWNTECGEFHWFIKRGTGIYDIDYCFYCGRAIKRFVKERTLKELIEECEELDNNERRTFGGFIKQKNPGEYKKKDITAKQARRWIMYFYHEPPMTYKQIAEIEGITASSARRSVIAADLKRKKGLALGT